MYYGHLQLKPIDGVSGREPTAFTKKTIKELLEEEQLAIDIEAAHASKESAQAENIAQNNEQPKQPVATPRPVFQTPPHLQAAAPAPVEATPAVEEIEAAPVEKPRSFLKRLIRN